MKNSTTGTTGKSSMRHSAISMDYIDCSEARFSPSVGCRKLAGLVAGERLATYSPVIECVRKKTGW
ncbi:MAG: hypothetical protein IKG18_09280 [Atopobiaceae bacterium]|nr:hypothetical protein [Atopobiaceae bacterium]